MIGKLVSFWDCLFLGAMLNFWGVCFFFLGGGGGSTDLFLWRRSQNSPKISMIDQVTPLGSVRKFSQNFPRGFLRNYSPEKTSQRVYPWTSMVCLKMSFPIKIVTYHHRYPIFRGRSDPFSKGGFPPSHGFEHWFKNLPSFIMSFQWPIHLQKIWDLVESKSLRKPWYLEHHQQRKAEVTEVNRLK